MQNFRITRLRKEDGLTYMMRYVQNIKKVGQVYQSRCPFHNERTGSFTIFPPGYVSKNGIQDYATFYCFGCNYGGDIIKFKSLLDNISREQAVIALEKEFNLAGDEQGELEFLQSELAVQEKQIISMFSFADMSLLIASYCRKYLMYIKEKYPEYYLSEMHTVDYYFRYVDYIFERLNINQVIQLFNLIKTHLYYRKEMLKSLQLIQSA